MRGDTLSEIATKYKVDSDDIVRVNRITDNTTLRIGMDLVIPGAVRKAQPQATQAIAKKDDKQIPVPTKKPTKAPVTISEKTGLKSSYEVAYSGKSRGFV